MPNQRVESSRDYKIKEVEVRKKLNQLTCKNNSLAYT